MLATSANFAYLLRLQPMRSFHLIYVMFCLLLGGLVEEYLLRARVWRRVLCFGVLSLGMFKLDVAAYPASPHIERPGVRYQGEWLSGFLWIRDHTPKDALFALDAEYFSKPGVDLHGFRAVAERSVLADRQKDGGAASIFRALANVGRKRVGCNRIGYTFPKIGCWPFEQNTASAGYFWKTQLPWTASSALTAMARCGSVESWISIVSY